MSMEMTTASIKNTKKKKHERTVNRDHCAVTAYAVIAAFVWFQSKLKQKSSFRTVAAIARPVDCGVSMIT